MLGFSEDEKRLIVASQRHRAGAGPSLASDVAGGANGKASLADQWVDFLVEQVQQDEGGTPLGGGGGGSGEAAGVPAAQLGGGSAATAGGIGGGGATFGMGGSAGLGGAGAGYSAYQPQQLPPSQPGATLLPSFGSDHQQQQPAGVAALPASAPLPQPF